MLVAKIFSVSVLLLISMGIPAIFASEEKKHSFQPEGGFVPNEITAIRIAEAVLIPIYGEKKINSEKPFKITLKDDVWTVEGTFPFLGRFFGGVAVIEISKKDARILRVSHGK
jgi:hypothetical protein